jgi:uncharacterized protein YuzE
VIQVRYDSEADALYVTLRDAPHSRTDEIDCRRLVDYDDQGHVIGVEFLVVSKGIDLEDVPEAERIAEALRMVPHPVRS